MKLLSAFALILLCTLQPLASNAQTPRPAHTADTVDAKRLWKLLSGDTLKQYFFVMLKKGTRRNEVTDTAIINKIQAGHMANMDRMAKAGKLKVAGPFGDEGDWRGIFIFDCNTKEEVEALLATDPAVAAGRLGYEIHPWWTQVGTVIR